LADETNRELLSAAVVWEVAIKRGLGKLAAPDGFSEALLDAGAVALSITLEHAAGVEQLPRHHRDPFDRVLVAQARAEGATLVSADPAFAPYDVTVAY
jgi:PIN domain nuclease of toxin-antitoxin system